MICCCCFCCFAQVVSHFSFALYKLKHGKTRDILHTWNCELISLINITVRVVVEFIEKVPILIFFLSYCRKIFRCWGVKTQTHVGSLLRNEYICLQNCKKFFVPTMRLKAVSHGVLLGLLSFFNCKALKANFPC